MHSSGPQQSDRRRAMAMLRSLANLLFVFLLVPCVVPAALAEDALSMECKATEHPDICDQVLRAIPESLAATPPQRAVLFFQSMAKEGQALSPETQQAAASAATKDQATRACLMHLDKNLNAYMAVVAGLAPGQLGGADKFEEARKKMSEMLVVPSNSRAVCTDAQIGAEPIVARVLRFEDMLRVTLELFDDSFDANTMEGGESEGIEDASASVHLTT
ncbi:hypothetical protein ACP70R_023340 [Stipagrostis hirtigluma subsp. patula]